MEAFSVPFQCRPPVPWSNGLDRDVGENRLMVSTIVFPACKSAINHPITVVIVWMYLCSLH